MKKFLAAALAGAMVVSMAATAFALDPEYKVTAVGSVAQRYDGDDFGYYPLTDGKIGYGKTVFYMMYDGGDSNVNNYEPLVTEADAVKGVSIKQKWEMNGSLVEKVEIVKKKNNGADSKGKTYSYVLSVKTKESNTTKDADLIGTVTLRKSGKDGFTDTDVNVNFTLGYSTETGNVVPKNLAIMDFGTGTDEDTIEFAEDGNSYFTVNTTGQAKLLAKVDVKYNADIAAKYPSANLDFFTGNGASFNKTGVLSLAADEGTFVYAVDAEGNLVPVKTEYDEYEGVHNFKTRTLGSYVISDSELKIVAPEVKPEEPTTKPNPGTGAVA